MSPVPGRKYVQRVGAFGASVAIMTLVGLLSIPTIIAVVGPGVWGVIAVGQSMSLLFSVIVSFGWGTIGPATVAALREPLRPQFYADSLVSRLYLFAAVLPLVFGAAVLAAGEQWLLVAATCVTYLVPALGASWYFVGSAQPRRLLLLDTLPSAAGTLLGLGLMVLTDNVFAYITSQLVANCVGVTLSSTIVAKAAQSEIVLDFDARSALRRLKGQRHGVITAATSSLYVTAPLIILAAVAPGGVSAYALADRFFKYGVTVLGPVVQVLQGSIPHPDPAVRNVRIRLVARVAPVGGLLAAAIATFAIPAGSRLLSGGDIEVGYDLSIPIALVFGSVAVSQAIGLACLIPIGEGPALAASTVLGALLGIPLIFFGAMQGGAVWVAWAVAVSESAVAAYQLVVVLRFLRRRPEA